MHAVVPQVLPGVGSVQDFQGIGREGCPAKTFWDYSEESPDRAAIIDPDGRVWTRGDVERGALRTARWLLSSGIGEGDAVAIVAPNCAEFVIAHLAITSCGAWAVPVNYHLTSDEIGHVLITAEVRVTLVDAAVAERLEKAVQSIGFPVAMVDLRMVVHEADIREPEEHQLREMMRCRLGRTMLFTSATTGKPKAVVYGKPGGHAALARQIAFRTAAGTLPDSGVVHLCTSMLYFAGPLEGAMVTLHMGNVSALMRSWSVPAALGAIERYGVTETFLVPIMIVQLSKLSPEERLAYDLTSLRLVIHAGAPCPKDAKHALIDWLGPIVCEGYGATEGSGTFVTSEEWLRYPGTVGRPIPGSRITVRGPDGKVLPPGTTGLIYISSYTGDRFEYLNDPDSTERCYVDDQFTAGDIGYLNEEGYLFILDRAVNMINCGGANIYPAEIEAAISAHPHVADCAVVARRNERFGEIPHAVIQRHAGSSLGDAQLKADVIRFLVHRLAPGKLPHSYEVVDALPRDPNGKLLKRRL